MVLFIAAVSLVNIGVGFALAVYLARQHRSLLLDNADWPAAAPVSAELPRETQPIGGVEGVAAVTEPVDESPADVESLREKGQQPNDDLANLETQVLTEHPS